MEDRFGVTRGLRGALEHQLDGGFEGRTVEVGGHRVGIGGITGVLLVDHGRHAAHDLEDLLTGRDPVVQPVGHVLRGDAARGPVLHQGDVVDVRDLGGTVALIDPTHHVPEDALGVVLEFGDPLVVAERRVVGQRQGEQVVERRGRPRGEFALSGGDVDVVVVGGVECRRGG